MYPFITDENPIQLYFHSHVCCGALYYGAPSSSKASCMTWRSGDGDGGEESGRPEALFLKRVVSLIAPPQLS